MADIEIAAAGAETHSIRNQFRLGSPSVVWRYPPAAVLGWIPYVSQPELLPNPELAEAWRSGDSLLPLVFESGNPIPPAAYGSLGTFWDQANLREFRAALSIERLAAAFDRTGAPVRVEFVRRFRVGFTPIRRLPPVSVRLPGLAGSSYRPEISADRTTIRIRLRHEFKLGLLAEVLGRLKTGSWAPYASVTAEIEIGAGGMARMRVLSSAVPSLWLYQGDARTKALYHKGSADLTEVTLLEWRRFVDTDRKVAAPEVRELVTYLTVVENS